MASCLMVVGGIANAQLNATRTLRSGRSIISSSDALRQKVRAWFLISDRNDSYSLVRSFTPRLSVSDLFTVTGRMVCAFVRGNK